jgi:hypothetical protein
MNIREYINNCPIDCHHIDNNVYNNTKPKHYIRGTRFGQKEMLGLWSNREEFSNFHVMYGVAKESIGKIHFANNIESKVFIYYWGDYCDNKVIRPKCHYHIGASPFFYGHLLNSRENVERKGTIFYLPRSDNQVVLGKESKAFDKIKDLINNAPKPVTVLSYLDSPSLWEEKLDMNIKILSYDVTDSFWQMKINEVFLKHEYAYIPNICSDFFYATISGCKAIYYDAMDIYTHNYTNFSIIPSYHRDRVTSSYLRFDEMLKNMFTGEKITEDQFYLACKMLSVDKSECSEDLAVTMERLCMMQEILSYQNDTTDIVKRHYTPRYASPYRSQFKSQEDAESLRKNIIEDYKSIKKIDYIDDFMLEL